MSKLNFAKFVSNRLASLVSWDKAGTLLAALNVQTAIAELANRTFLTYFNATIAISDGLSASTSQVFVPKISQNSGSLQGGTYFVMWCAESSNSKKAGRNEMQVIINGVTVGESGIASTKADDWRLFGGCAQMTLPAGVVPMVMNYRCFSNTAQIRRAKIIIFRIGP